MPIRDTRFGPKRVQRNTTFTNRVMLWRNKVNKDGREIMFPWLDRTKNKEASAAMTAPNGFVQHQTWHAGPLQQEAELSEAAGMPRAV